MAQEKAADMITTGGLSLTLRLFDPSKRWPSDDDGFEDTKIIIWENLSTKAVWMSEEHFTQWTSREWARGIRPLDSKDFKRVLYWGPIPNYKDIHETAEPE